MRFLPFLLIFIGCAHQAPHDEDNLVTLDTALLQAQTSYLKGCVDALHDIKIPMAFEGCRDKSLLHKEELRQILEQEL